jgi:hypothetical protein
LVTLREATIKKVLAGITTIEELVRVAFEEKATPYAPETATISGG